MDNTYTVTEAATKLNLSAKTLRRWEETGRFTSSRTVGGQRRYTTEDIQILDALNHNLLASQSDLITKEQATTTLGIQGATISDWERSGRIQSFITSANTYYIKSHLQAEYEKAKGSEPKIIPPEPPRLTPLSLPTTRTTDAPWRHDLKLTILNMIICTTLIATYHLITSTSQVAVKEKSGSVQGASITSPIDPKLDIIKNLIDQTGNFSTAGSVRVGGQFITPRFTLSPSTRPKQPVAGTIYFDASTQSLELYTGTEWQVLNATSVSTSPSATPAATAN